MSGLALPRALPDRIGDEVQIDGGYQHRARTQGFVVQRFWHAEKERMINRYSAPSPGDNVLDVGCGSGVIADMLCRSGANVLAIDANADAIEYARRTFPDPKLRFERALVDDIDARPASINRTYCLELIEHIYHHQVETLAERVYGLTRRGGTFTLTTPNYAGVWPYLEKTLDILSLVPQLDYKQHVSRFTAPRIRDVLTRAGWKIETLTTFSTFAPWLSVLGWNLATATAGMEDRIALSWGSILYVVARKE